MGLALRTKAGKGDLESGYMGGNGLWEGERADQPGGDRRVRSAWVERQEKRVRRQDHRRRGGLGKRRVPFPDILCPRGIL